MLRFQRKKFSFFRIILKLVHPKILAGFDRWCATVQPKTACANA